jgi:hypothetical protein
MSVVDQLRDLQAKKASKSIDVQDLKCTPLSQFEKREIEWLWKDRIPMYTLSIFEGDGGRGKSTLIADICSRLSKGETLPEDDTERPPKRILLLAAEDDPNYVLRPRFETHGANLDNVMLDDQAMILNEDGLVALTNAIIRHKIDIVVVDPIVSFLGQKLDMNKGNDVRSVLGPLVKLGRDLKCTFIVVRHFNKSRDGSASQRGAGSVDFRNAARAVMQVIYADEQTYLALEKSNYAAKAKTLTFSIVNGRLQWGAPSDLTADQLHSTSQSPSEKSALDEAVSFLEDELKLVAKPTNTLLKSARKNGIAEKTLRRAKDKLGLVVIKQKSGWMWKMLSDSYEQSQDGQNSQPQEYDQVGHLEQDEDYDEGL